MNILGFVLFFSDVLIIINGQGCPTTFSTLIRYHETKWDVAWKDLTNEEQEAWTLLEANEKKWGVGWEADVTSLKCWNYLTNEQQTSAMELCFTNKVWDKYHGVCSINETIPPISSPSPKIENCHDLHFWETVMGDNCTDFEKNFWCFNGTIHSSYPYTNTNYTHSEDGWEAKISCCACGGGAIGFKLHFINYWRTVIKPFLWLFILAGMACIIFWIICCICCYQRCWKSDPRAFIEME